MRQYLTTDQTAKLIELGFEEPKGLADADKALKLALGSIFFPIGLLILIIFLPFKVIMKLYKINK